MSTAKDKAAMARSIRRKSLRQDEERTQHTRDVTSQGRLGGRLGVKRHAVARKKDHNEHDKTVGQSITVGLDKD